MKIIGIIAEYNPFHNGHAYQIETIRKQTGADYIIVAMSGDFVQRGTPAVIDKYTRTQMALSCGADMVIELPVLWATASAEFFAMAGVTLFDKLGCIDGICFGAESDNLELLSQIADFLVEEPKIYQITLTEELKNGASFPVARAHAIAKCIPDASSILNEPNNILAIEYLKAIKKRNSTLTPHVIQRQGSGYHDAKIATTGQNPASATAIRNLIFSENNDFSAFYDAMPQKAYNIFSSHLSTHLPMCEDDFSSILNYILLSTTPSALADFGDCGVTLANRLYKYRTQCLSYRNLCMKCKSRDLTYTRISRVLLHLLLNITTEDYSFFAKKDYILYLRILGFRKDAPTLFKEIKHHTSIPFISKLSNASEILDKHALTLLEKDIFASELYHSQRTLKELTNSVEGTKEKTTSCSEYTHEIVRL